MIASVDYRVSPELDRAIDRLIRPALGAGILLLILSVVGAFFNPDEFFRSYLLGYLFWFALSLGSLAIVMVQYLTGGAWGVVTRRPLEAMSRTLPLLLILFIPVAIGIPHLYDWAHADLVRHEFVLKHRGGYMNPEMFILRTAGYFAIWLTLAYFLNRWSAEEDVSGARQKRLAALSAPGLILYVFTLSFAAVDWASSLETDWYSTMWGFLFVAGQGLETMAFIIIVLAFLSRSEPLAGIVRPAHYHALGKLLLMFVMIWGYFSFSQLLIVWAGNLTDEIPWYLHRLATTWGWLGAALIVFQFIVPFLLLLSRRLKRTVWALSCVVGIILLARYVDLLWIVMPGYYRRGMHLHWLNFSTPLAIGGLWITTFLWQLRKHPLLPLRTPELEKALHYGAHEG
jgi:hypothetical protein